MKLYKSSTRIYFIIAVSLMLSACFSPWKTEQGTIAVTVGGGETRAALTPDVISRLNHTIKLSGGPGPDQIQSDIKENQTVHFAVASGSWNIFAEAYLDKKLTAAGSASAEIEDGQTAAVSIIMKSVGGEEPDYTIIKIIVSPIAATVNVSVAVQSMQFSALVEGSGNPPQDVIWTVTGQSAGTTISPTGELMVDNAETPATVLRITATSAVDPSISGYGLVTVTAVGP